MSGIYFLGLSVIYFCGLFPIIVVSLGITLGSMAFMGLFFLYFMATVRMILPIIIFSALFLWLSGISSGMFGGILVSMLLL